MVRQAHHLGEVVGPFFDCDKNCDKIRGIRRE